MDAFGAGQIGVLEKIAEGAELNELLAAIVDLIERQAPEMICSIVRVDEARGIIHGGVGPNLPPAYLGALEGAAIGPAAGSCGTAAARKQRVIVEDIATDPLWVDYRDLALGHGLAACWSTPILASEGAVLGTFAMYYSAPRRPTEEQLSWVDRATHLAAIALGRYRAEQALRASEARAQRLARLHAMAAAVNDRVTRAKEADDVWLEACRAMVDSGVVVAAHIGVAPREAGPLGSAPVQSRGGPGSAALDSLGAAGRGLDALLSPEGWRGIQPAVAAAMGGGPVVVTATPEAMSPAGLAEAARAGVASCGAFPLRASGGARGALLVFGAEADRFGPEEVQVFGALVESLAAAAAAVEGDRERARLLAELGERVKELTVLHAASRLLQAPRPVDERLFTELVALIPGAMQHPARAGARLAWGELDVSTPRWTAGLRSLAAHFDAGPTEGANEGVLEVAYVGPADGPEGATFLDEERELLRSLADMLGSHLRRVGVERALREREALLAIAGKVARIGGWSLDLASGRVSWSDELRAIYGVSRDAALDIELALGAVPPEFVGRVRAALDRCIADGAGFDFEVPLVTTSGRRIWVRAIGQAERDASGAITRVQGAVQDVAERHKLEDQLRQSQKLDAIGQLAGGIAHDFNNLLSVILSCSSLAMATIDDSHPLWGDLAEIDRAAIRAGELTRQLLAFGRRQILQPRVMNLNGAVSAADAMLRRVVGDAIAIHTVLGADVGRIFADPGQIEQVIVNLAINARDAMPDGGTLTLETLNADRDLAATDLTASTEGDARGRDGAPWVMLAVTDTGVGMDAATRARIFEPFFTTKDVGKGTGLGLAMVWGIVQQSGGHIWVYSEVGVGTTFKVYLPRVDDAVAPTPSPRPAPASRRGGETILLVEDEDQVRLVVEKVLRRAGYTVLEADDGLSGLARAADHDGPIELLITDVSMPQMSGPELAARLEVERPDTRVLYISGYTENAIVHHGVLDGDVAFLAKPFAPDGLLTKVRAVLDD